VLSAPILFGLPPYRWSGLPEDDRAVAVIVAVEGDAVTLPKQDVGESMLPLL